MFVIRRRSARLGAGCCKHTKSTDSRPEIVTWIFFSLLSTSLRSSFCFVERRRGAAGLEDGGQGLHGDGGNNVPRQAEQVNKPVEPSSSSIPTITSEIGSTSHGPDFTSSFHFERAYVSIMCLQTRDVQCLIRRIVSILISLCDHRG